MPRSTKASDVHLALHSGVIEHKGGVYGSLAKDPRYATRMKEHARLNLLGKPYIDIGYGMGQFAVEEQNAEPVPKGFQVGFNPFRPSCPTTTAAPAIGPPTPELRDPDPSEVTS